MNFQNNEQFFKTKEVAAYLNFSPATIRRWLRKGIMKGNRIGRSWLIPKLELEHFLNMKEKLELYYFLNMGRKIAPQQEENSSLGIYINIEELKFFYQQGKFPSIISITIPPDEKIYTGKYKCEIKFKTIETEKVLLFTFKVINFIYMKLRPYIISSCGDEEINDSLLFEGYSGFMYEISGISQKEIFETYNKFKT